jgi:hypothetical protein
MPGYTEWKHLDLASETKAKDILIGFVSLSDDRRDGDAEIYYRRMWKNMAPICDIPIIPGLIPSVK